MQASELFYELETELLQNMVRYLSQGAIGSARWQLQKIQQLGALKKLNAATIEKHIAQAIRLAKKEIRKAGIASAQNVDRMSKGNLKLAYVLPAKADPQIVRTITLWGNLTANKFNEVGASLLQRSLAQYADAATKAVSAHLVGGITGRQAIAQICTDWAQTGIGALTDRAGRTWTPEAYAQMLVRTNQRNTVTQVQFDRMDELGEDLIEVSAHAGARPLCAPYQGRIFSRSGKSTQYPPLSSTSYGEPGGLFGINCGHVAYPYFPGAKKTYQPNDSEKNAEQYKQSQKQRSLERSIRNAKRELALQKENGDKAAVQKAQARVEARQKAMRSFIDKTGRTRRYDREQIYE